MKKIIMMLVTMSMILSLVACGNSKETSGNEIVTEESTVMESEEVNGGENNAADTTSESKKNVENDNFSVELTVDAEYANLPESQGFIFESNGDGTCTLTKIGDCTDSDIVIPEKSPAGDMVIGENAFSYCEDVTEVIISGSNIEVETYAFYDTGKDMNVKILNCTGVLDEKAFQSCGIADLTINNSTLELGENVFSYCEDLTAVVFDRSTVEIGTYAFYDSGDDATVTFSNCGLDIDDKSFQSCGITALNISDSETVMGDNAFSYCEDLTDVIIGVGNTEIGTYSFYDCTSLENVSIAEDSEDDSLVLIIDDKAFQSCSVQNVIIGRGKVELGDNAFSYCEELMSVDIKGVLSDIGDYAFYECPAELVISYNGGSYNKESIEDVK